MIITRIGLDKILCISLPNTPVNAIAIKFETASTKKKVRTFILDKPATTFIKALGVNGKQSIIKIGVTPCLFTKFKNLRTSFLFLTLSMTVVLANARTIKNTTKLPKNVPNQETIIPKNKPNVSTFTNTNTNNGSTGINDSINGSKKPNIYPKSPIECIQPST